jgi:hypothetical protein
MPKPPHQSPILPPVISLSLQQPPSPCTLTQTAAGFNIDWKGGHIIATRDKIREIKLAKKSQKNSVSIGTTHALEILGKSSSAKPVCPLHERVETSQPVQTSSGFIRPKHSESTNKGMPTQPQHTVVKQSIGEPPRSWSAAQMTNRNSDINSAERNTTANENLPALTRENRVEEETRKSRKRTAMNTQSTAPKHVKQKPKRRIVSWKELIAANIIATPIGGNFQGIDKVEQKLRTRTVAKHRVVSELQETNSVTDTNLSINPPAHKGCSRPDDKVTNNATRRRTNHEWDNGGQAFPAKLVELIKRSDKRRSKRPRHRSLYSS